MILPLLPAGGASASLGKVDLLLKVAPAWSKLQESSGSEMLLITATSVLETLEISLEVSGGFQILEELVLC